MEKETETRKIETKIEKAEIKTEAKGGSEKRERRKQKAEAGKSK
ncbi:hypothetical protein [Lachnoclostridium sp. Marseille-P6806]|nr:hypothetical protein [Lachnoclostridium sp. Marseille-P6806]